jgi:hypothetical protein
VALSSSSIVWTGEYVNALGSMVNDENSSLRDTTRVLPVIIGGNEKTRMPYGTTSSFT